MHGAAGLIAHQGGWDEALIVVAPVGLLALLVAVAWRRAAHRTPDDPGASLR